ncbi:hypothetical protein DL98DRAFT_581214 [Cadophora sp. DSE1049]|nr:hypothetical protein DL98DRAFT_581214 [Cadophora sp. DSE1049]
MALDQILDETMDNDLPHPFPFPSHDVDAAKTWLADPKSQDFSAWNQEKASFSGKWPILEALIAEVVGIQVTPCKKGWRLDVAPWISSALRTWMGRAICLWKNHEKGTKLHAHKHKTKIHNIETGDQSPTKLTKNVAEDDTPHTKRESMTKVLADDYLHAIMIRPICQEYDEIVNHIVRTTEVHGKYDLELQPSWHGYKKDPFDSTAKKVRRVLKDRMIEDGIVKQSNRVGACRSLAGVHLDHSVRYEDYPDRGLCRWIEDYFSEGYGGTVKAAILPPIHRPDVPSTLSTTLASQESAQLTLVKLATSDCGDQKDFIRLYGSDAGTRFDALQAELLPEIKCEFIEDDGCSSASTNMPSDLKTTDQMGTQHSDDSSLIDSDVHSLLHRISYPPEPEMLSPMSEFEFSNAEVPELEAEQEQDAKQELKLNSSESKPLDVKAIIEKKIKELAREKKLEQAAAHGDQKASKRPHI